MSAAVFFSPKFAVPRATILNRETGAIH